MVAEEIILAPVVTEKSSADMQEGKYTFRVAKKATKIDVKNAVEKLFEVKVLKVNTMTVKEKKKELEYIKEELQIGKKLSLQSIQMFLI